MKHRAQMMLAREKSKFMNVNKIVLLWSERKCIEKKFDV